MVATNVIGSVRNTLFHKHERKERDCILKRLSTGCNTPLSEELVSITTTRDVLSICFRYC